MGHPIVETPVQKMDCYVPDCQKQKKDGYKTKVGLTNHVKKWHQVAKDALSPLASTARTLFKNTEDESGASIQGNSRGEVNVEKVMTKGMFVCGKCEKNFQVKKLLNEHMEQHDTTKDTNNVAGEVDIEVMEEQDTESVGKEIENLVIVDSIVDSFVDFAFRAMRPNEAPETTDMEDKINLLFRQHQKLNDRYIVMTKANENRLEVVKEAEKLRAVATSSLDDLQETKKTNQALEECLKMKDTEIEAMEEIISELKKKAEDDAAKATEQARNIRAMEEELGVWDVNEEENENEEEADKEEEAETELENEWVSVEARRHNTT